MSSANALYCGNFSFNPGIKEERNGKEQRESKALTPGFISLSFDGENNHAALNVSKGPFMLADSCWK